jgi:hypothetical protein
MFEGLKGVGEWVEETPLTTTTVFLPRKKNTKSWSIIRGFSLLVGGFGT